MIFGKTWQEQRDVARERARAYEAKRERGILLLFPRHLDSGRWGWLERLTWRDDEYYTDLGTRSRRLYHDPRTVPNA